MENAIVATVLPAAGEWQTVKMFEADVRLRWAEDGSTFETVAADACRACGISQSNVSRVVPASERGSSSIRTPGGPQTMGTLTETGTYLVAMEGRKPEAKRFKLHIAKEMLPSLRQFGCYPPPQALTVSHQRSIVPHDMEILSRLGVIEHGFSRLESKVDMLSVGVARIERHMERVPATRKEIPSDVKAMGQYIVLKRYGGFCPCCEQARIFQETGVPTDDLRWDHWTSRGKVSAEDVWPVCDACNVELGEPGHTKAREAQRGMFDSFQKRRVVLMQGAPRPKAHPGQLALFEVNR